MPRADFEVAQRNIDLLGEDLVEVILSQHGAHVPFRDVTNAFGMGKERTRD